MQKRIPLGWGDLLVAMFLILLIGTAGLSAIVGADEYANRAKCASNLHQLGLAILLYQGDNQQMYPRTVAEDVDDPKPVWGTPYQADPKIGPQENADPFGSDKAAPSANDVTASLFLLMRDEQLTSACFICPAGNQRSWDFGGGAWSAQSWSNWDGNSGLAHHLSYSFQNPFASKASIAAGFQMKNPDATFAILADMNPGGEAVTSVTIDSPIDAMQKANSYNHQQEGQNVLYGDGHAEWQSDPFCGTQHDNIYTAAGPEIKADERTKAVITASSVSGTDSVLLPTALDIGFKFHPKTESKPLTPEQRDKLKTTLQGNYTATINGDDVTLIIDDKSLKYTTTAGTVEYSYEAVGASGDTLVVKLVAKDTNQHQRATLELIDGELQINTIRDHRLDYPWKKATPGGPDK